jgi:hypothetical protein
MSMPSRSVTDRRYIEPMFGLGPPAACRERLARMVPARQLDLFAVAWFAHAIAREGLAAYLLAHPCLGDVRRGLERLGERDAAAAVAALDAAILVDEALLDATERRVPADLYDIVLDHARAHHGELVRLDRCDGSEPAAGVLSLPT